MTNLKGFSVVLALLFASTFSLSAGSVFVESARVHTGTQAALNGGANGCVVSGATVATPSVINCVGNHNLADGDQVQVTGVGGTTTVNTTAFAKVTGYSATTFGLYTTAALTTGVTGTGAYTSGGYVTEAADVSAIQLPWLLRLRIEGLTANTSVQIAVQDSADGFVNDIRTLTVYNLVGSSAAIAPGNEIERTWRDYMLPSARVGENGRLRCRFSQSRTRLPGLIARQPVA